MATKIDNVNFIEWDSKHGQYLIRLTGSAESQEKRLAQMKASEDMYEALKGLLQDYSTNPTSDIFFRACERARDAIDKAEGKS